MSMSILSGKKIILGITGGIAAYKCVEFARALTQAGAKVRVVMTDAAKAFVTPMTLQAVSHYPVHDDLFDPEAEAAMGHIQLARWADAVVVAPASADFIARLIHGRSNDLLSTLCLATNAPLVVAPAMNQQMWTNAATRANLTQLAQRGVTVCGPASGIQACGDVGPGRMLEPPELLTHLENIFTPKLLAGTRVLVTAGPTREPFDPVRYLSNYSSGKMGYAMAAAAAAAGAEVVLVSGPVALEAPVGTRQVKVETALEMLAAVMQEVKSCQLFISTAAVADYRFEEVADSKHKKAQDNLQLNLMPNPDILAQVASLPNPPMTIGFAAETDNVLAAARTKLKTKKIDMIVANQVGIPDQGFDSDTNIVTLISQEGEQAFPPMLKTQLARELINYFSERLR